MDPTNIVKELKESDVYRTLLITDDTSRLKYTKVFVCAFDNCNTRTGKKSTIMNHIKKSDHLNQRQYRC